MKVQKNASLKRYNTFGIDKKAKYLAEALDVEDLISLLHKARELGLPVLILGGGSNILLTKDVEAFVIKINIKGIQIQKENAQDIWVRVGAGENWHAFVVKAIASGWAGIENLSLIPGTVGASPMQNIGAYGVEIKEVFDHLEAVNVENLETECFNHAQCEFGYRESVFKHRLKGRYIITHVTFRLSKTPSYNISYGAIQATLREMGVTELSLDAVSKAVIHIRKSKLPDPEVVGNAGSFFKNPTVAESFYKELQAIYPGIPGFKNEEGVKVPAAWLIEQAGWKGMTLGKIGVHKQHPLVLVNYGGGDGEDIKNLSMKIQKDIEAKFGILLQPEVNFI